MKFGKNFINNNFFKKYTNFINGNNKLINNYNFQFNKLSNRFFSDNPILKLRNIGISAHIDSGKTTFTERVLFYTGKINKIHEVKGTDKVGATMDSMELERERGITIQSAATHCYWKDHYINIIDTPGHVDFTIEVERALRVLDGAVLLICAASGVQPQSLTVNKQMNRYKVPRIVFINKCDRAGANPELAISQVKSRLKLNACPIQVPIGIEADFKGVIDVIEMKACYFEGNSGENVVIKEIPEKFMEKAINTRKELIESVANVNPELEEIYLTCEDPVKEITVDQLKKAIRQSVINRTFAPVFMGSAVKNKGVQRALDGVIDFLPNPIEKDQKAYIHKTLPQPGVESSEIPEEVILKNDNSKPFLGMAFKLQENKFGQLTYIRAYQGNLKRGDMLNIVTQRKKVKVSRIVKMHADNMEEIQEVQCGEIFAIFGIDCYTGETFSGEDKIITLEKMHVPESVMSLTIKPKKTDYITKFLKAINRFQKEDPTFKISQNEETEEMIMSGMGELHLQVYAERIRREYDIEVDVGSPQVNYRESISQQGDFNYLHKKQSGGSGQFARVVGKIVPTIKDFTTATSDEKANIFVDKSGGQNIPHEYIPAIEKAFHEMCKRGPLMGCPVIGVKYILEDGQTHAVDSSSLAFGIATKYSMTQAFENASAVLLEPIMDVEASGPKECSNSILNTLMKRKGNVYEMITDGDTYICRAEVSLTNMFGYATELRSCTQGVGEFSMEYKFHNEVNPQDLDAILEKRKKELELKSKDKKKGGFS